VFLAASAIQGMKQTGPDKPKSKGSIVNISSVAGLQAGAGAIAYTASKGAVRLLSKSVALYCAEQKYDIRCNSVHPGGVDTPIFDLLWQMVGREQGKAFLDARHPIGRMSEASELARGRTVPGLRPLELRDRRGDRRRRRAHRRPDEEAALCRALRTRSC
jgi:3(or 17)beta-hydroxysteroid dehydrogenase